MIRTKIEKNFTFFFFNYMKIKSPSDHPSPLEKKSKSLHGTSIISKHAQYVHSVESAPTYMYVDSRPWLETTMFMFLMPVPSTPTPPPLFEKFLDPRHDVVLVLHLNCGSNCQYMYRYMYMHPPPTPTKYRLFTIRKHAFLSLFLNDAMLRACRSM